MNKIETGQTIGVDEFTMRGNGSGEIIHSLQKIEARTNRRGVKDLIIKPNLAAMLTRLGVGPLQALDIERQHRELLRDDTVPNRTKIAALQAQPGIRGGIEIMDRAISHRNSRNLAHAIPAMAEIELFSSKRR